MFLCAHNMTCITKINQFVKPITLKNALIFKFC